MEANLIDRDVAEDYFGCSDWEILAKETLREVPLVSAVPVVRCRECRFWEKQEWGGAIKLGDPIQQGGKCKIHVFGALENDFCSRGQRKEAAHDKYPSGPV